MLQRRLGLFSVALAALVLASSAAASCVQMTAPQQRARANLIIDAVALDRPTFTGIERFRVIRSRKGTGPRIVRISTGRKRLRGGGIVVTSVSIDAARGELWRIFARRLRPGVFQTTARDGSRRLR